MSFAFAIVALVAAGLALLRLLGLRTGARAVDVALAWLLGSGWFAALAPVVRFGAGVPLGRAALGVIVLAPVVASGVLWWRRRRLDSVPAARAEVESKRAGWLPRPLRVFVPIALYVAIVTAAVLLHGANTPTQTDDAVRVRAFAPMLAFDDGWPREARAIFAMAGPLPTFVPAFAWMAVRTLDQFHVNYAVLAELVALLVLVVGLGTSRGSPERGWASAFALLSIPLFVYHCTSTYSDAVLAMRVAGGMLFVLEYARTRDRDDAARALLLLGIAALVKREGQLVAAAPAAVLLGQLAWERWREQRVFPWRTVGVLAAPVVLGAVGNIAAVGLANAFPMIGFVAQQAGVAVETAGVRAPGATRQAAAMFFDHALFRSGNQGMIYWALLGAIVARARALPRSPLVWPLAAVAALLAEVAVSSIFLIPEYTVDQSTVHRALLVVSVPAALWIAAAVTDAARAETSAAQHPAADGASRSAATPPRRRRPRRAIRP